MKYLIISRSTYILSGIFVMFAFCMLIDRYFLTGILGATLGVIFLYVGVQADREEIDYYKNFYELSSDSRYIKKMS
jgi:hypothetical protein